ncbi:MAG: hypothetical protein K0R28_2919 [Paenibacillus sp.]|nr:hypothetical protein [Paenibacillus sp.]
MWRKRMILAAVAVIPLLGFQLAGNASASTESVGMRVFEPDTLRIPAVISLLARTPTYADPAGETTGWLEAQDGIRVIRGEYGWSRGHSWWRVSTPEGENWIHPEPWNVDVPPPGKLTLFEETPVYASRDESAGPTAVLAPQEAVVTGAQKQWFYANGPQEKRWVRIRTSWLGDQWVHLPVKRIGYVKPADYYVYHLSEVLLDDPNYEGPMGSMAGPKFESALNRTMRVTGEFVSAYDRRYQVETEKGPKYTLEQGRPVVRVDEPVTLKTDTPAYGALGYQSGWMTVLEPQTLAAFEKLEGSTVYHVHTELGDRWIDTADSEPADTIEADFAIELSGPHELFRFPGGRFQIAGATLSDRIVRPSAYWVDKEETLWYVLRTGTGTAWFKLNPARDRIRPLTGMPTAQIAFRETVLDTVKVNGTELSVRGTAIGYLKEGTPYLSLRYLAERFGFREEGEENPRSVTLASVTEPYSFRLQPGSTEAATFWDGKEEERLMLREAPVEADGDIWLNGEDAQHMAGLSIDWFEGGQFFYLFRDEYDVELPDLPATAHGETLNISAYRYERWIGPNYAKPKASPLLTIRSRTIGADGAVTDGAATNIGKPDYQTALVRQSASAGLAPGANAFTMEVKVGSRILARQDAEVAVESVR